MSIQNLMSSQYDSSVYSDAYKALFSRVDPTLSYKLTFQNPNKPQNHEIWFDYEPEEFQNTLDLATTNNGNAVKWVSQSEYQNSADLFIFNSKDTCNLLLDAIILSNNQSDVQSSTKEYSEFKKNCSSFDPAKLSQYFVNKKLRKNSAAKSNVDTNVSELACKDLVNDKPRVLKTFVKPTNEALQQLSPSNKDIWIKDQSSPTTDWNYFSLRRTCFRGMSSFYKEKFEPMHK